MAPRKIGRRAVLIALLVGLAAPITGKADEIDHYITAQMQRLHIPGASLAIVGDGGIVKAQGYGFANLRTKGAGHKRHCLRNRLQYKAVHRRRNHDAG